MKSAIIIGGNGLIGRALTNDLVENDVAVLILSKADSKNFELNQLGNELIDYCQVKQEKNWVDPIAKKINENSKIKNPVVINLAWKGKSKLVDGNINDQIKNINFSCECVALAQAIEAKKYVATGSIEELILEKKLENETWLKNEVLTGASWYALAKISARMQSSFEAYQRKIDFCYTQISIVINKNLNTEKFVEKSLKTIILTKNLPEPNNKELCNISSSEEIARQLRAVAQNGINKRIYTLGTGDSNTLDGYFRKLAEMAHPKIVIGKTNNYSSVQMLKRDDFSLDQLYHDTGYRPKETNESLFKEILEVK